MSPPWITEAGIQQFCCWQRKGPENAFISLLAQTKQYSIFNRIKLCIEIVYSGKGQPLRMLEPTSNKTSLSARRDVFGSLCFLSVKAISEPLSHALPVCLSGVSGS